MATTTAPRWHGDDLAALAGLVPDVEVGRVEVDVGEHDDYHDVEVPVLAAALAKRAPGYVSLGFPDPRKLTRGAPA